MQQPLPEGTRLHNQYRIVKRLGSGGFAITYLAIDEFLNREVAIKELFPYGLMRAGNTKSVSVPEDANEDWTPQEFERVKIAFLEEGRILAKIEHPNIVRVLTMFSENNTHYLVMEYIVGQTLHAYSASRGAIPFAEALALIRQIAEPVVFLHKQQKPIYHRDLNPKNVLLRTKSNGKLSPVLIDFGLARVGVNRTKGTKAFAYAGYAPLEQYISLPGEEREFGPYVDVYSLAALLFRLLTKLDPTSAEARAVGAEFPSPSSLFPSIPEWLSNAVLKGMAIKVADRPKTVQALLEILKEPQPQQTSNKQNTSTTQSGPAVQPRSSAQSTGKAALLLIAGGIVWWVVQNSWSLQNTVKSLIGPSPKVTPSVFSIVSPTPSPTAHPVFGTPVGTPLATLAPSATPPIVYSKPSPLLLATPIPGVKPLLSSNSATRSNNNSESSEDPALSRAKQLGLALMMYIQDYDETFPPMDDYDHFRTILMPYLKDGKYFLNPSDNTPWMLNRELGGKSLSSINSTASEWALRGAHPGQDGLIVKGYADGHVRRVAP